MANLALLPNELLDEITDNITHYEIESYALTCRRTFENSFAALQKHRSNKRFTQTTLEISPDSSRGIHRLSRRWDSHPFWLLRTLLDDPTLASYIRHLKVIFCNTPGSTTKLADLVHRDDLTGIALDAEDSKWGYIFRTRQQKHGLRDLVGPYRHKIGEVLQENEMYFLDERNHSDYVENVSRPTWTHSRQTWHYDIMKGAREETLGCILLLLRDIDKLTVLNCEEIPCEIHGLLKRIRRNDSVPPEKKPLSKLEEVELGHVGDAPELQKSTLRALHKLAKIPGVRVVKADRIEYRTLDNVELVSRKLRPTQIKSIHLHHCDVFVGHESWIFGAPCALEKFHFSSQPEDGQSWQALQVTTWLRDHATETLEELTLIHPPQNTKRTALPSTTFVGSLRSFKRLKYAKLMVTAFTQMSLTAAEEKRVPGRGDRHFIVPHRLVHMLPASLERLVLCGEGPAGRGNISLGGMLTATNTENLLLLGMKESKGEFLPHLREIEFEHDPQLPDSMLRQLRDVGLEVTFREGQIN